MPETPPLPDDDALRSALATTPQGVRDQFQAALAELEAALEAGTRLVEYVPARQVAEKTWQMGWVEYDDILWSALQTARRLIHSTELGRFRATALPRSVEEVDQCSLAEVAAFVEAIHHQERMADGLIADCLEAGTFLASLQRLRGSLPRTGDPDGVTRPEAPA